MNITLRHLQCFVETVNNKSVSAAAEKLFISQSAVSISIRSLEKILNERLFDRVGKQLMLTDSGKVFYSKSLSIIDRVEELEAFFSKDTKGKKKDVLINIGASSTIANYVIPDLLKEFYDKSENIKINLRVGNTENIISDLLNNSIDMGFIEGVCFNTDIEVIPWIKDELIVFVGKDFCKDHIIKSVNDIIKLPWILREKGSGTRDIFERAFGVNLSELNIISELGHSEAVKKAVKNNMGISCLSKRVVEEDVKRGLLKHILKNNLNFQRDFYLIIRKDKYKSEMIKLFIDYALNVFFD